MADRTDFFFRQRVTEAELDLAFELLENADRNLAADIGVYGITSGAEPAEHQPVPNLTIDLVAPARAYDHVGQRIFFGTDQNVDCSVDHVGIPTEVSSSLNERWLGVFLTFDRLLSDPRTDGNSQQVYFRRDESFQIVVRQAAEGPIGSAPKVSLVEDELLVCDVLRKAGQTQILDADIDISRRQSFIFSQGDAVEIVSGLWNTLAPAVNTVQSALDEVDAELTVHFGGTARRHPAGHIDYAPHGFVGAENVQAAIDEVVDDLSSTASGTPGASKVGADAATGTPHALPAGNVDGQLSQLLGWLNAHVGATSGAHNASTIAVLDAAGHYDSAHVEGALLEIIQAFIAEHFPQTHADQGKHRAITQPVLGSGYVLLWDSLGNGNSGSRFRAYAHDSGIVFTINAEKTATGWHQDTYARASACLVLSWDRVEFHYYHEASADFTDWASSWWLPMNDSTSNSSLVVNGTVQEIGNLAFGARCPSGDSTVFLMDSITYRNRFYISPSSITLTPISTYNFAGDPTIVGANRDGFSVVTTQTVPSGSNCWWRGDYTATN